MTSVLEQVFRASCAAIAALPDTRHGPNLKYSLGAAVLGAFACFFLQCPSLRCFECRTLKFHAPANCRSLCGLQAIPWAARIRTLLDTIAGAAALCPLFLRLLRILQQR